MRLSRLSLLPVCLRLMLPMSLLLIAGLSGCGPASPDNAPTLGSRASQGESALSQKNQPPRTDPFALAPSSATASLVPLASENGMGPVPEKGRAPVGGDSPNAAPIPSAKQVNPKDTLVTVPERETPSIPSAKSANPMDALVIPEWIAKDLHSPDVDTRLRALETWAKTTPTGSIDPLNLATGNDDARTLARALELIEQDLARTAEAGK